MARDLYIGLTIDDYTLDKYVGAGQIGSVYRAVRPDLRDTWACKVIPEGRLKQGWERELQKISRLRSIPEVVQFHSFGDKKGENFRPFSYVMFDFIQGQNLEDFVQTNPALVNMAFVESLTEALLRVLHACEAESIVHG